MVFRAGLRLSGQCDSTSVHEWMMEFYGISFMGSGISLVSLTGNGICQ